MSDLTDRLRRDYKLGAALGLPTVLGVDAANEIERLDDDNARLAAELAEAKRERAILSAKNTEQFCRVCDERNALQAQVKGLKEALQRARDAIRWSMRNGGVTDWSKFLPYLDAALAGEGRPCNPPFERVPQHSADPGFGPVPPPPKPSASIQEEIARRTPQPEVGKPPRV